MSRRVNVSYCPLCPLAKLATLRAASINRAADRDHPRGEVKIIHLEPEQLARADPAHRTEREHGAEGLLRQHQDSAHLICAEESRLWLRTPVRQSQLREFHCLGDIAPPLRRAQHARKRA